MPDFIPEPSVIMLGVAPWDNRPHSDSDPCPTCRHGVRPGDNHVYCARCNGMSPLVEAKVRAAKLGLKKRDEAEQAAAKLKLATRKLEKSVLSEATRRRVWNGYRGSIFVEAEACNASKEGRDWLTSIGQEPDWSKVLKKRRWGEPMEERGA